MIYLNTSNKNEIITSSVFEIVFSQIYWQAFVLN